MSIGKYLDKIRNAVYGREVRESIAKGIETTYNDAAEKHDNANMEVILARGTHSNLNNRLDKMDEVDKQTTAQLAQKASKNELNTTNTSLTNTLNNKVDKGGNEQITWAMASQDFKEQITGGNTAVTGKDSVNTTSLVDNSVTSAKRTALGEYAILHSSTELPDFDFNKKTLTIKRPARLAHRKNFIILDDGVSDIVVDLQTFGGEEQPLDYGILLYDTFNKKFVVREYLGIKDVSQHEVLIAVYHFKIKTVHASFSHTINGRLPNSDKINNDLKQALLYCSTDYPNFDFKKNILVLPRSVRVYYNGGFLNDFNHEAITIPLINEDAINKNYGFIFLDPDSFTFKVFDHSLIRDNETENLLFIGSFNRANNTVFMPTPFKINGHFLGESSDEIVVNDSGKEFLFRFPVSSGGSYLSDHTFVGDELWVVPVSDDTHTNWVDITRYGIDFDTREATELGKFKHNWGHANTVDYNQENGCIVVGNGSTSSNTEPNEFYVFENAESFKEESQVDVHEKAIVYEVEKDGFDWGKQLNVVWGQANGGKHNIVYALSNYNSETGTADTDVYSSDTQVIHKILLGQGGSKLESGTFIEDKVGAEFNGTYKVLKSYEHPYEYDFANQGTQFYNGYLYEGIAHDRISFFKKTLADDGVVRSELFRERIFGDNGAELPFTVEGLAIKDDYLLIGSVGNEILVYKL